MKDIALFTDVSVDPDLRVGVGVHLAMPMQLLETSSFHIDNTEAAARIKVRRFEDTTSTKLELQTVLWAIQEQRKGIKGKLRVFTDSQSVSGLFKRRARLVAEDFLSRRSGRPLKNASLYRSFFELHDTLDFEIIKVEGHTKARARDTVSRIFAIVDKKARKALRLWMHELADSAEGVAQEVHNENWCVYVLKCRNNALYTGMTNNLERRLTAHDQGRGSKYVRAWKPFELVKTIPCKNAGQARRLECELKKLTRKEKIDALGLIMEPITCARRLRQT